MNKILYTTFFTISPDVVYTLIDDEAIVMGPDDDQLFSTSPVGTRLLQLLETSALTIPMLQEHLLKYYEVDASQCLLDVDSFITSLLAKKLITSVGEK